jgi:hypothetical protein
VISVAQTASPRQDRDSRSQAVADLKERLARMKMSMGKQSE